MRQRLKVLAICCVTVALPVPLFAQDSGADTYKARCAMCHGENGTANTPAGKLLKAASFSEPAIVKIPDLDRMAIVKKGKDRMPAFGDRLTDDQIKSVVAYIHTLQKLG